VNHIDTFSALIGKYLAGETSPGEEQELFAWIEADEANKKFFEEIEQVWKFSENASASPFQTDTAAAWAKVEKAITPAANSRKSSALIVSLSKISKTWRIAAAILLAVAIGLWWFGHQPSPPQIVEVKTGEQEKKELLLPDGSRIWMNENSKLAYLQGFSRRRVTLEGEAFFEVKRMENSPFEIASGQAKTTVLGTSFNVRAYPGEDRVEVTVESGKVALAATKQPDQPVLLPAGASGIFDKKTEQVSVEAEKIGNAEAWKTQKLVFDNALVKDVLQSLERYFDTEISVSNEMINECHYSSVFEQPELDEAMKILAFGLNLELEKTANGYVLKGKGCEAAN
jgi:ferric-dicitrate binding protein FerR (iron transport regulator)